MKTAYELIQMVELEGKVFTGDALYCQREFCQEVVNAGGDYLVIVKANQRTLYEDIETAFAYPVVGEQYHYAESEDIHGDRQELRRLWSTDALRDYLDWPGSEQVCKVEREVERKGKLTTDVRYAITSLEVEAVRLLGYVRGHWKIENRLHYVRDVTLGEDGSQVRSGAAPEVMAILRNIVLGLLRRRGDNNIAAAIREIGWKPGEALRILGLISP